jgi:hypothetical protein
LSKGEVLEVTKTVLVALASFVGVGQVPGLASSRSDFQAQAFAKGVSKDGFAGSCGTAKGGEGFGVECDFGHNEAVVLVGDIRYVRNDITRL